jgi:hypothetical protein
MAMFAMSMMIPVIGWICVRAFRPTFTWRLASGVSISGSMNGLIVVIFAMVRYRRRRVVRRKWNVYMLLRLNGGESCRCEVNHHQRKSRLHVDRLIHGVRFFDERRNHFFNRHTEITWLEHRDAGTG